jgi:hypothetical protein
MYRFILYFYIYLKFHMRVVNEFIALFPVFLETITAHRSNRSNAWKETAATRQ